jgi:hypothetical protein
MREEKEKGHLAMPIRRKEDHEKKLGTIRRPVLEY